MTLFRRMRRPVAGSATAAMLTLGLVAVALQFSSPASARSASSSCADADHQRPDRPCDRVGRLDVPTARCWSSVPATTPVAACTCSRPISSMR